MSNGSRFGYNTFCVSDDGNRLCFDSRVLKVFLAGAFWAEGFDL
jgi:hypothetical protein